jgi:integrase
MRALCCEPPSIALVHPPSSHELPQRAKSVVVEFQKAVSQAARAVGLTIHISCHTVRRSFATYLLPQGLRHQDGPDTPRAQRGEHHHGVSAYAASRPAGRAQPAGLDV